MMTKAHVAVLSALLTLPAQLQAVVITFQVRFSQPVQNWAEVFTEFSSWGDHVLQPSATNSLIHTGTFELPDPENGYIRYRFATKRFLSNGQHGFDAEADPGRIVFLTSSPIVLPVVSYGVLNNTNNVTFQVDMRGAAADLGFDPAVHRVYVIGNFSEREVYLEPGPRSLYHMTIPILTVRPGEPLRFNFAINAEFIEPALQREVILKGGPQLAGPFYYGNILPPGEAGRLTIRPGPTGKVTLSWVGAADVRLQTSPTLQPDSWTTIPGTEGQSSFVSAVSSVAQLFRLIR